MDEYKRLFYKNQAQTIIKHLNERKMEGYYCENVAAARAKVLELLGDGAKSVGYGGSVTIHANGFKEAIAEAGHHVIRREKAKTPEEKKEIDRELICADAFLMSTNAITLDGELVNIDGHGSRVSFMIYGPEQVIIVAGMNKVVSTVEEGIHRTRNMAAPPNTVRLGIDTPCARTGRCGNCLQHTICSQIVITRDSRIPFRIKVVLVGEELGY